MSISALVRSVAVGLCAPLSVLLFAAGTDNRIPDEVRYKSGYVNPVPKPADFTSAMLWGIAIADTREPHFQHATIEIAHTQLICRAEGKDVILNDDTANVRGGLYRRHPWFGTDVHDPMLLEYSDPPTSRKNGEKRGTPTKLNGRVVVLPVGTHPDRVWHFWAASPRASLPQVISKDAP